MADSDLILIEQSLDRGATTEDRNSHARVADVLEALARREGADAWGVRELADELRESRSTVNRSLAALAGLELADEWPGGKYGPGTRLRVLADAVLRRGLFMSATDESANALATKHDVTIVLSLHDSTRGNCFRVLSCEPASTFRYRTTLGREQSLTSELDSQAIARGLELRGRMDDGPVDVSGGTGSGVCAVAFLRPGGDVASLAAFRPDGVGHKVDYEELRRDLLSAARHLSGATDPVASVFPGLPFELERSAVSRTIGLLFLLVAHPGGIQVGRRLFEALLASEGAGKRLVASAIATGVAIDGKSGSILPGPQLARIAARLGRIERRLYLVRPLLRELASDTGETIGFLTFDPTTESAQIEETLPGWRPIQYRLETGVDVPLYAGAGGKAILAYCSERTVSSQSLARLTDNTPTLRKALVDDLDAIRARGWAVGDGERIKDAFGVAVPYFRDGSIAGSVTATIPRDLKEQVDVHALVARMGVTCERITSLLSITQ